VSGSVLSVFTDGAARGNPGHAGMGVVVLDETGSVVAEWNGYLGQCTNNVAEYTALLSAVEKVAGMEPAEVRFHLDSELVVKQLNGLYRVKDEKMKQLFARVQTALRRIPLYRFTHVVREKNARADRLANEAIDAELGGRVR